MLIGANRLFALPNVDDTERILPSSPQVKGEGHGRFESFLYNTSAPQEEVPDGGQKTRPEEGPETVASQLSSLFSMASKDGRLKLPSFASPMEEQEGTMVASKVEGTSEGDSDAYLADADSEINVEDIVSSQIDDLLSSLLGPMESQTDYSLGDTGPIKPRTDYHLGDTGPIEPQMRHYEAMAELSARPEIISPGGVSPVVDKPSASVIPLDQPTSSEVTTQADLIEPETVAPMAQLPTELPVTQVKFGQAPTSSGETAPSAKPESTPATSEPQTKVDQAPAPSGEVASSAKLEGTPAVAEPQIKVEPTKPEVAAQPDRLPPSETAINSDAVRPEPPTGIGLSVNGLSESVNPSAQSTPSEVTTQADPIEPETVAPKAQLSTELPVTQIKFGQAPAPSGEATPSAKPEGKPAVSESQAKVEQVLAPSGEVASSAKLEGTPAVAELQTKVEPTKPEAAVQPDRLP
ncbi:MAG: hypothetical protein EOM02_11355, partial [Synergistales bacterium]|nr:hypothetical protein [Synergistales bacterium]